MNKSSTDDHLLNEGRCFFTLQCDRLCYNIKNYSKEGR